MNYTARYFSPDEMREIALRLAERAATQRNAVLRPDTAWLAHRGILSLLDLPNHRAMLTALCKSYRDGKCASTTASGCLSCMGLANAAMNLIAFPRARE